MSSKDRPSSLAGSGPRPRSTPGTLSTGTYERDDRFARMISRRDAMGPFSKQSAQTRQAEPGRSLDRAPVNRPPARPAAHDRNVSPGNQAAIRMAGIAGGPALDRGAVMALQGTAGNQAVLRLLQADRGRPL